MTYTLRLRYGDLLLSMLRREVSRSRFLQPVDWPRVEALCDRYEHLLPFLVVAPLVWEGDYA